MPLLQLNGVTLPAALGEVTRLSPELIGEEGRAFSGADLSNVRAEKEGWRARLTPRTASEAAAIRALVRGKGYSWSFDTDLYADRKGLGPTLSTGCTVAAGGKYGSRVKISAGNVLTYGIAGSASVFTLLFWKKAQNGGAWEHFIFLGSGDRYKAGATTAEDLYVAYDGAVLQLQSPAAYWGAGEWQPLTTYAEEDRVYDSTGTTLFRCSVSGDSDFTEPVWNTGYGQTTVEASGAEWMAEGEASGYFDDVMILPANAPATWAAQLYAEAAARAWTPLPRLRLAGDAAAGLAAGFATVTGRVQDAKLLRVVLSGTKVYNAEPLDLELREA